MTGLTAPKSGVAVGDQSEEIFRATNMPSVSEHSDSSQQRNYGSGMLIFTNLIFLIFEFTQS